MINIFKIFSAAITILFMIYLLTLMVDGINQFIDKLSLIVIFVLAGIYTINVKGETTYINKFGDGAVLAGWLGFLMGLIVVLGSDYFAEGLLSEIGGSMVPAITYIFYGYFIKLLTIILD
jgi:hypothetical protein